MPFAVGKVYGIHPGVAVTSHAGRWVVTKKRGWQLHCAQGVAVNGTHTLQEVVHPAENFPFFASGAVYKNISRGG